MEGLACDVVGCKCTVTWVCTSHLRADTDDFLCQRCWTKLRLSQSQEAACYLRDDVPLAPEASFFDFADEEPIRIG